MAATPFVATAHHNYVSHYDMDAPAVTIEGTVDSFWFVNPHIRVYVRVPDKTEGKNGIYIVEGRSRNILAREGWKGSELKKGDPIKLAGTPARTEEMKGHLLLKGGISVNGTEINFNPGERKVTDFQLGGDGAATSGSHLDKTARGENIGAEAGGMAAAASVQNAAASAQGAAQGAVNGAAEAAESSGGMLKYILIGLAILAGIFGITRLTKKES